MKDEKPEGNPFFEAMLAYQQSVLLLPEDLARVQQAQEDSKRCESPTHT